MFNNIAVEEINANISGIGLIREIIAIWYFISLTSWFHLKNKLLVISLHVNRLLGGQISAESGTWDKQNIKVCWQEQILGAYDIVQIKNQLARTGAEATRRQWMAWPLCPSCFPGTGSSPDEWIEVKWFWFDALKTMATSSQFSPKRVIRVSPALDEL